MILRRTLRPYGELRLAAPDFVNPRRRRGLDDDSIAELAVSIVIKGLQSPLLVRPDGTVLGGQRRYLAIGMIMDRPELVASLAEDVEEMLGRCAYRGNELHDVPVVVADGDAVDARERALLDNIREDLTSYELAAEVATLVSYGKSGAEVGRRIGRSKSYISRLLKTFNAAAEPLMTAWRLEQIPYERVMELAAIADPLEQSTAVAAELVGAPVHRGSHGRPGITKIRALLEEINRPDRHSTSASRDNGAYLALRYAAGLASEAELRELLGLPTNLDSAAD